MSRDAGASTGDDLPALIRGLLTPQAFPHDAPQPRLIETHISWVILAGAYAYKLKKPVDLGFLDFTTLARRRFFCDEELRLNRRLAPDIYLDVVPITGTEDTPRVGGSGAVQEWAVRMRAFPAEATFDRAGPLSPAQITAIAARMAEFHGQCERAPQDSPYGAPDQVLAIAQANLSQLQAQLAQADPLRARLAALEAWTRCQATHLHAHLLTRQREGQIRECHGDLHLGNIAWVDDVPVIFDALEFSPTLRYIDPLNECAFLMMDLAQRGQSDLAWLFLNSYLETTGDYAGLPALNFYLVYRALVRAKVGAIRSHQGGDDGQACAHHIDLAEHTTQPPQPALILMHGVSGSGKTHLARQLAQHLGAVHLRADVERKRLFGLAPLASSRHIPGGIYTREAGARTRQRLLDLTRMLLDAGLRVIVDATFIARDWRAPFEALADAQRIPWRIISLEPPEAVLRARLAARHDDASEADVTVLDAQLAHREALDDVESARRFRVTDTSEAVTLAPTICESLSTRTS